MHIAHRATNTSVCGHEANKAVIVIINHGFIIIFIIANAARRTELPWMCRKLIRHGIAYVKMHIENEDLLCRASSLVPPSSLAAASSFNFCTRCEHVLSLPHWQRPGYCRFHQNFTRWRILSAKGEMLHWSTNSYSSLSPHQSPPCRAHCVGHTTWYTLILPSRAMQRYSVNQK